ncbi:hypothetical protein DL766_006237 [Monosporascus sp. MC13-8B]|nr:hypothetical protein DL766_006237 [Monosporascus sp. MC13-8B]
MLEQRGTEEIRAIQTLLQRIPNTEPSALGKEMATGDFEVVRDLPEELVVRFLLHSKTVGLMHAKDLDKGDTKTYDRATRAKAAKKQEEALLGEGKMPIATQQYLMACILTERENEFGARFDAEKNERLMDHRKSVLSELRSLAREIYWLDLSQTERADARKEANTMHQSLESHYELAAIQDCWCSAWNNSGKDVNPFRNYLKDQPAAKSRVWEFVEEDIFVTLDKNLDVVFCKVENIVQLLYGHNAMDLLDLAIDLWSLYAPLPLPETSRHVVDRHIRRIHPELDTARAAVETLPNAKMCVAHYGCWADKFDTFGRHIWRTMDALIGRLERRVILLGVFPKFAKAVFGKASEIMWFMIQPLDNDYYKECVEVFENLPEDAKLSRHKDINDFKGRLAGLLTLGNYDANEPSPKRSVQLLDAHTPDLEEQVMTESGDLDPFRWRCLVLTSEAMAKKRIIRWDAKEHQGKARGLNCAQPQGMLSKFDPANTWLRAVHTCAKSLRYLKWRPTLSRL